MAPGIHILESIANLIEISVLRSPNNLLLFSSKDTTTQSAADMSTSSPAVNMPAALRRRLLNDIAEIQQNPYPRTHIHFDEANILQACLVLTPEDAEPLHLTMLFTLNYPIVPPVVTMQTQVVHPNVYGSFICSTILNQHKDWTPAYTLRGIVIQLLSFFCSSSVEQEHGGAAVELGAYRQYSHRSPYCWNGPKGYSCAKCGFTSKWSAEEQNEGDKMDVDRPESSRNSSNEMLARLQTLPDEVLLLTLEPLDTIDLITFSEAIPKVKNIVDSYDLLRVRELQCFCLKKFYMEAKLGVGVAITPGRRPVFRSEFDLLSQEAFFQHDVRKSIQGVAFDKWIPLPLSRRHWKLVKGHAAACLHGMHSYAKMSSNQPEHVDVLYHFMNNIVVQFSADAERSNIHVDGRSTLSHASEKAVEAYFALFHLLLCLATENPAIVAGANRIVSRFLAGPRTKSHFPDLGHVLVAALISDAGLTEDLTFKIIKEAVLRNVVWMLDSKGAGMAELAYLEPSAVSDYRLVMTFHASRTSYRLLMFLKLFSSAARPPNKSLVELRDALFDTHGVPPPGTSSAMATQIRKIREIDAFPPFLRAMGIQKMPSKSEFTAFLRRTITESVDAGYSVMPLSQSQLYTIRKAREAGVERAEGVVAMDKWFAKGEKWYDNGWLGRPSFFPGNRRNGNGNGAGEASWGGGRRGGR